VRAKNGDFRVDSSSIELEAPDLRMEESKLKPNGDVEIALSRLQRQGDIPEEDSEERRLFAIRVRCKVVSTQDAQVSLHYDDTYRLWGGDSIRMIPTQVLIERDQSESVLWLTIVDMLGDSEAEEDFPYLLSFVKRDGGEEEIALLPENIQRVSRSRWKVGLLPPKVDPEVKVVSVRLRKKGLLKNSRSLASTNLLFMQ
jgi:hypothetical protein